MPRTCTNFQVTPGKSTLSFERSRPATNIPSGSTSWMIVEPTAGNRLEDNLNPVGRLYSPPRRLICVLTSLAQEGRHRSALKPVNQGCGKSLPRAGLNAFDATETAFNMILGARA